MIASLKVLFILSIFVFLSARALFHPGFFRTIDDITTVRIEYMRRELVSSNFVNNFPVRMSGELANGFSYPLYLFYAPLTYYAGALLMIFGGLSHIVATKFVYLFPMVFGPFAFYFAARQKFSRNAALIAAIMFTLFSYRGTNIYLRGAAPEAWAIAFVPLAFAGVFLLQSRTRFGGLIFAIGFFLVLTSHNLVGVMFTLFVALYGLIFLRRSREFWKYFALGLGLAAFHLLPQLFYLKQIRVTYLDINNTYILQTLEPVSALFRVQVGELVWRVSGVFLFLIVAGLIYFWKKKKKSKEILFWGISSLVLYLLLFEPFFFFWKLTAPIIGILQFVWRILSLLAFAIPLFVGFWLANLKNNFAKILLAAIVVAASLSFLPSFKPADYSYDYEYKPEGDCATTSWQDEFLPTWVVICQPSRNPIDVTQGAVLQTSKHQPLFIQGKVEGQRDFLLTANKYYFPGWHMYVDGQEMPLDYKFSPAGIFRTDVSAGAHNFEVVYKKTFVMWFADFVSVGSLGLLLLFSFKDYQAVTHKIPHHRKASR